MTERLAAAPPGEDNLALCNGRAGQTRAAAMLLTHGPDIDWVPGSSRATPLDVAHRPDAPEGRRKVPVDLLCRHGAKSARHL